METSLPENVNQKGSLSTPLCTSTLIFAQQNDSDIYSLKNPITVKSIILVFVVISVLASFFYFRGSINYPELKKSEFTTELKAVKHKAASTTPTTTSNGKCRPFVLYSQQKSGTHYVMEVIHHSPAYFKLTHEILHDNEATERLINQTSKLYKYLEKELKGPKPFILQHNQATRFCSIWDFIKDKKYRVVLLVRDPFEAELSTAFYRLEDSAHCKKGEPCKIAESVSVDPAVFVNSYKRRYRHMQKQLTLVQTYFKESHFILRYEKIVQNPEAEFAKLFKFLQCSPLVGQQLESSYVTKHKKKKPERKTHQLQTTSVLCREKWEQLLT